MKHHNTGRLLAGVALACALAVALSACGGPQAREARYTRRGQEYLAKGEYDKARVEFRNALQIAPRSADLRYDLGLVAEKLGNLGEAAQYYSGALDSNHDLIPARVRLGRLLLFVGLTDQALQQVDPGLKAHPNDPDLLTVHAAALQQKKRPDEALKEAQRALALDPNNEAAISLVAGLEIRGGQAQQATSLVEAAIKRLPASTDLRLLLTQVYLDSGNLAAAEREVLELTRLQPGNSAFRLQLGTLYARSDRLDDAERTLRDAVAAFPKDSEVKRYLADFLWVRRSHAASEAELRKMVSADPSDPEVRFILAGLYEREDDASKAAAQYRSVIDSEGWNAAGVTARERLAAMYAARNDTEAADRAIKEILAHNPRDNEALSLRAGAELSQGKAKAAIADLRDVLRDQPNSGPLLETLSRAYLADGEIRLAEDTARHAVELDPASIPARMALASVLIVSGKFEPARVVLTEMHKQKPGDPRVVDLIYRCDIALKDIPAAQAAAAELAGLQPDSGVPRIYLGILAESDGRNEEALADFRRAAELQPHSVEPVRASVSLLRKMNRYDEAFKVLDEAAQRDPASAAVPALKGETLMAQGHRLDAAASAFRQALQLSPTWWNPYRDLASVELARSGVPAAAAVLHQAAAQAQFDERQRLELAGLLTRLGDSEGAIGQYEAVLRGNPGSQIAAGGLGMLLVSFRSDRASLDRAVSLVQPLQNSTDWQLLDAFGWVQYKKQDLATALPALQKAALAAPAQHSESAQLRFHLGMAELKAGRKEMAKKDLADALARSTRFLGSDEAREALAQLNSQKS